MEIVPQDAVEKKVVSLGAKIGIVTGILTTALGVAFAALGGMEWVTKNLDLLMYGLGLLASGGAAVFVAIRRMRIAKGMLPLLLLLLTFYLLPLPSFSQATTFSGLFNASTSWRNVKTVGSSTITETVPALFSWQHTSGTNSGQMNAYVSKTASLAAGASNTVNLASVANNFGDPVAFSRLAFIALLSAATNQAVLSLGGAASDPFYAFMGSAGDAVKVAPGGMALFVAPGLTNGYTVGTATNLLVRNTGTNSATYSLILGGVQ